MMPLMGTTSQSHDHTLVGRWALVTGGARRIGRAISLGLGSAGVNVAVHHHASPEAAAEVVKELHHVGVEACTVQADLDLPEQAAGLVQQAVDAGGPLDIVINSASIFPETTLAEMTLDEVDRNVRINAWAPFRVSRDFAALQRTGVIVNILDSRMLLNDSKHVAYHLSKRMLFTLTRMMAMELAPRIRVNAVAPGPILPPQGKDEAFVERVAALNPMQKWGEPEQVAEAVEFLLKCDFVTGQVLFVDGGLHLKGSLYGS